MTKDLQSFKEHEKEYIELHTLEYVKDLLHTYEKQNQFIDRGFKTAISRIKNVNIHIDVGCGTAWLLYNTSPLFKKVIGIEPTKQIIDVNYEYIKQSNTYSNVEFVHKDMVDGMLAIGAKEPVFVTTSTVLSHIQDFYVKDFLKIVNDLPEGSYLFFDERYDTNIQKNMWHIRSRNWWAKNLPNWQLDFFGLENSGYKSGIFGKRVQAGEKVTQYELSPKEQIMWHLQGWKMKIKRISDFIKRKLKSH